MDTDEQSLEEITLEDLIREFNFEYKREQDYFDYMYRSIQFSFVAVVTVFIAASQLYDPDSQNEMIFCSVLLTYVLPVCIYVFGAMYTFNAYALAVCGNRAAKLHKMIYYGKQYKQNNFKTGIIKQYFLTNRILSMLSYGVALGFYLLVPLASQVIAWVVAWPNVNIVIFMVIPGTLYLIYVVILGCVIAKIVNPFFCG